ncbi:MAG TPA: rhamnosidase, partial [Armatimonadetes bacterium]|nr:rhamnosidase [Armatimonadota bacterium]
MDNWGGISIATLSLCQSIITASIQPINLRCEYRVNPLGIDQRQPRLSWSLKASNPQAKGLYQTAYQILVASSRAKLDANEGDLWDTGKVESSQSSQIVYAGKPLQSEMECWWKVRVWDQNGRVSEWSEPARWTMGLLEPTDWQAKWIGYDAPMKEGKQSLTFENCKWIWFPEGDPRRSAPIDTRYFRRRLEVRPGRRLQKAQLLLTADDQFMLYVNGHKVEESDGRPDAWRRPKMVDVTAHLRTGMNVIAIAVTNTGGPAGLIAKLVMEFEGDEPLVIVTDSSWRVTREEQDNWAMPDLDDSDWLPAMEIGKFGNPPWGDVKPMQLHLPPQPFLRKTFVVDKPIQSATAYVSALGTCEVHLNGKRITDDVFIPGRSDFRKRVYYRTYDVTELVQRGKNALGAILGDEWYAGYCGGWNKRNFYGGEPRLLIQLHLKFNDGTKQIITTDETWKATYGPILEADFYHGETYDARREMPGWDTPNFDDSNWAPVDVTEGVNLQMTAHLGPPVRRI